MRSYDVAFAYIAALTGDDPAAVVCDWRMIHDVDKGVPAIPFRGTLPDCWPSICRYNDAGYGAFVVINALDGNGRELVNVSHIRVQVIDLDNLSAQQNYERAAQWQPAPAFAVQSSPGKFHVYWQVQPYTGNDYYSVIQRKLRQVFDGDGKVIDATRVMRLPGTLHMKRPEAPHLVICWQLAGYASGRMPVTALADALASVAVHETSDVRHDLGDPALAAPSLEWIQYALDNVDPNKLDRYEWISFTSAIKQSGWTVTDPATLMQRWLAWCEKYDTNDRAENEKQWNSIRQTQVGWPSVKRRVPSIDAYERLGGRKHVLPPDAQPLDGDSPAPSVSAPDVPTVPVPVPQPPPLDCSGEILSEFEQREWFKGCVFVNNFGKILTPGSRYMNATAFNGAYGGKQFIITSDGKTTNEAWAAATRSTLWTVPKVDHIRFVPQRAPGEVITDELGRKGFNTYIPAIINATAGDVTPWLRHIELLLPVESDRWEFLGYLAHNVRFPGYKIPWAFLLQSAEGAGKGFIKRVIRYSMGGPYVHFPNAQELIESGSKFNAWMRGKLFILVDEIKVDERRDMIEILKPMISEAEIEIQGKGHDQDKEDNYSNWGFFSNYKDAIPINKNGRRFAIFYSALQSASDIAARGMNDDYFNRLTAWHNAGGDAHVAHWLLNYPIALGAVPMRAPDTSSTVEAHRQSRGPVEQMILDAIEDGVAGFRGGFISTAAVLMRIKATGGRTPHSATLARIIEGLGFVYVGRAVRPYMNEGSTDRAGLYALQAGADVASFGRLQGYE